jgi:hypothetical protein
VLLRWQTPGGIDENYARTPGTTGADRIEGDRRGISPLLCNDGNSVALAPLSQLLAGGGAKGVAGGQEYRFTFALQMTGQLAD